MDTPIEIHSVVRTTQKPSQASAKKKAVEKIDTARIDHITEVFNNVKSQLHARLVTSVLDIMKKNEKFRRTTHRSFEHISVMALCMDANISEHSHLFDELHDELSSKFHSMIIRLDTLDQYSSIHNILKATKTQLNKFYPDKEEDGKSMYFQLSRFMVNYNLLKESEKRSLIFIIPEFELMNMSIFENLITLLSLQIKSMSISFVLGLSGGDHSLQRLVSTSISSRLSIDTIYDSSARKYYEYIIKALFLAENDKRQPLTINAEQLRFIDNGYFESFSLAWMEHALKFIIFSESNIQPTHELDICLFNAIYVSCNQLPNYPLGRYRSSFYDIFLSHKPFYNDLILSVNSSTLHQLDTCLNSFMEHKCHQSPTCLHYSQLAKKIFVEQQQQQTMDDAQSASNILRSLGDRKLNRYRDQVLAWLKPICESLSSSTGEPSATKINETLLRDRLVPMTRSTFIRELTDIAHWKQGQAPDLAVLYRTYAESGTKIPLSDWFESFASMTEEQEVIDDQQEKSILARFVHGLAELDYLGFTKTSLQRSYHATKLTWDS